MVTRVLALELSCVHGDIALEKSIALLLATMLFHILGVTRGSDVLPLLCREYMLAHWHPSHELNY